MTILAYKFRRKWLEWEYSKFFFFFKLGLVFFWGGWLHWVFIVGVGFLQFQQAGATLHYSVQASHCSGFSCCGARALGARDSVVVACRLSSCGSQSPVVVPNGLSSCGSQALECRLNCCGAWVQLLRGMWDLPRPVFKPMSPALAGGFLTTAPPGKPL